MTMAMPGPGWDNGGYQELVELLRRQVADRLATEGAQELSPAEREQRVARLVDEALDAYTRQRLTARQLPLDPPVEAQVAQAVRDALTGLGPLTPLLADPSITNILITGSTVFVTRTDGSKDRLPPIVTSSQALIDLIRDIAARVGTDERRFDRGVPRVSIRLPDGSRLFATMAVSRHPSVSIRRFTLLNASLDDLCLKYHAMDPGLRDLFTAMVLARKNIIICGGAATGKTTVLRAFAKAIPPTERLITIEDVFELGLDEDPDHPDCVAMQAREPNVEGQGGVDHAERLSFEATAMLVAEAVDFVVHLAWSRDGVRVVSSVREVLHADGREVISNEVFKPGPDRRAVPATPIRTDTLDELVDAGFNPDVFRGW